MNLVFQGKSKFYQENLLEKKEWEKKLLFRKQNIFFILYLILLVLVSPSSVIFVSQSIFFVFLFNFIYFN